LSLTVVGSIAFDAVHTPFGEREKMLGGSAVHFSLASSFFTDVRVVGPVGDDFTQSEFDVLENRGIITDDIERVAGAQTFFWKGHYEFDLNTAHTDDTQLNVFGDFEPKLSDQSKSSDMLFLANIQPDLQRQVRAQCDGIGFAGLDTMNLWIDIAKDSLLAAMSEVDCVLINDAEIRQLTGESNLARAAKAVMELGPSAVIAKQGEYGAALFTPADSSPCPVSRSKTCVTPPAPATASRAGSSATSTASVRSLTNRHCGSPWVTAPCSPPTTSKNSAPRGSAGSPGKRSTTGSKHCGR